IANAGDDCGSTKGAEQSAFMNGDACVSRHVRLDIHVKTSACYTIMQTLVYFISICFISIYKVTVHQIK
ncbi:MAG: hypothetical protein KH611_13790, partial [Clostridium sp.]|nr:hypothetical protein [Clostridium sp.]